MLSPRCSCDGLYIIRCTSYQTPIDRSRPSNHTVVPSDRYQHHHEHGQIAHGQPPIVGHRPRQQDLRQPMHLVRHAHKDERRDDYVQIGKAGQQHQYTVPVGGQPNVVLANEQLQRNATEPRKERRETRAQHARYVAQHQIADDRDEHNVRVDLLAVVTVGAHEGERGVEADAEDGGQRGDERHASIEQVAVIVVLDPVESVLGATREFCVLYNKC